ncbi:MAG: RluA family pseudouridine synthase [bacterium]
MIADDSIDERKPLVLKITEGQERVRLDKYLVQALPQISRHKVHELLEAGLVTVNDRVPKKSHKISPGETIAVYFRDQKPQEVRPEAIPLDIRYEDEHLLVVNKPAGMVVHPAHGHFEGTLVNALLHHFGREDAGPTIRPGIVHRLDKGTSGLLVVAKNDIVHRHLTEQFSERTVKREYDALVWGRFKENEGTIEATLGRHPGDRKRFSVVRGGKRAVTHYVVRETFDLLSLLALRLGTGRTHQIRVHLSHIYHPVFGDPDYGGRTKRLGGLPGTRRQFMERLLSLLAHPALHARSLGFVHPVLRKDMSFEAEMPEDLGNALRMLREESENWA